ncbi:hypothetical protein HOE22_06485 [Candidatus Woesearchaeota archaeon]|jgi:hypothetical protein|nr:hypothetical protein [Candidatus Woesearchaeota archaeon]MBT4731773.1 hypothetical protein [Candidatus Woesearchaeota archaeon]MBT7557924.1 hypothetical protein [Candidatus Woesearchaeota archaeon]
MGNEDKRKTYNSSWENLKKGSGWNKGKDSRVEVECKLCGKVSKVYPSHADGKKFCSVECRNKGQSLGLTAPMREGTGWSKYKHIWKRKYNSYRQRDEVDFTFDEMCEIMENDLMCYYCGSGERETLGLDRIDNNVGHIKENCVVCCELCNRTRGHAFSIDQMKLLGEVIKTFNMDGWRIMSKKSIKKMMENDNWKKSKFQGDMNIMESKLLLGDSIEKLKEIADHTVDLLCTDPPYG